MSLRKKGFTLIELLVVISIIAVLSVVGLVAFQGVRVRAQDARIKSDLNAIKKAYEVNYDPTLNGGQGGYKPLADSNFSGNKIPKKPDGSDYTYAYGPNHSVTETDGYKVTATLGDNTTTSTVVSNQGTKSVTQLNSCDPGGSLSNGLIGYWKMDENSGSNTKDSITNTLGDLKNTPTWVNGKSNSALSFNGSSNYVDTKITGNFSSSDNFTVTAWIKTSNKLPPSTTSSVVDKGLGFLGTYGLIYRTNDNSTGANALFGVHDIGAGLQTVVWGTNVNLADDQYHLIVGIRNRSLGKIYVYSDNAGVVEANEKSSGTFNFSSSNISIGARGYDLKEFFSGTIDDVRIYNRALSASDINLLYSSGQGCFP